MDENQFFREATLKICGNLEIEQALQSCLLYLQDQLPVDIMFLEYYDHDYNAMRSIARATESECELLDQITPLSREARRSAELKDFPYKNNIYIFGDPDKYAISREMLTFHKIICTDLMVMNLIVNDQVLGALVLISQKEKFNNHHADLLGLLKDPFIISMANALKHREVKKLKDLIVDDNRYLHGELRRISGDEIIGANFGLRDVMQKVHQVAPLDSPVLLLGETGVGKDVIANAIHYSSNRGSHPFVSVNCGAIPDTLIDSELFGHEKGAFTGALSQKRGRFERANGGTIFLDEIGELPLQAQVRLLKVLQDKEIERVGGIKTIPLDIRIIAATNRNLDKMVKTQQFRADLLFRLNVFPIWIPPLRERTVDIPTLVQHFIALKSRELKLQTVPSVYPGEMERLMKYSWPGNVRELQNIIERTLILNHAGPLQFDILSIGQQTEIPSDKKISGEIISLDGVIRHHIKMVLHQTHGKVHGNGGAAQLLGVNASTLRNRMNKLGIKYGRETK